MGIYDAGDYARENPSWHVEDSPWKAAQIQRMLDAHQLRPRSVCEIGCGAGEILIRLSDVLPDVASFKGYEISPQAFALCRGRETERVQFAMGDGFQDSSTFDLVLVIDVVEHVEDYYGFLKKLRAKGEYKLFHVPLDLSAQTVLRASPLLYVRSKVGHIHYFTKETFIAALVDSGYSVVSHFFTSTAVDLPVRSWPARAARFPRKVLNVVNPDLAARLLGGFSLLVLAK